MATLGDFRSLASLSVGLHLAFGYFDAVSNAQLRTYQRSLDLLAHNLDAPDGPQGSSRPNDIDPRDQLRVVRSHMFAVELSMQPVVRRCKTISFAVVAMGVLVLTGATLQPSSSIRLWWSLLIITALLVPMPVMTIICAVITRARGRDIGQAIKDLSRQVF